MYQAKVQADNFAKRVPTPRDGVSTKRAAGKLVRFDKFVLRYFKRLYGTRGIARRHLRSFVESVQRHAAEYPRISLFAVLAGISSGGAAKTKIFNARIMPQCVLAVAVAARVQFLSSIPSSHVVLRAL